MEKKRYLIVTDLDETLLTTDKKISDYTINAIRELYNNGHYFVMCSGRPYQGMVRFGEQLGINDLPLVALNGAAFVYRDYKVDKITNAITLAIPNKIAISLFKETYKYLNGCLGSSISYLYTYQKENLPFWIVHENKYVTLIEGRIDKTAREDILTLNMQVKVEYLEKFRKIITKKKYNQLLFFFWGIFGDVASFEVSLKTATKGCALRYLKELWNIDDECTIAFGDGQNDLSMLNEAYNGVTMCNAREFVLSQGKEFTFLSNNEDGIIDYLKKKYPCLWKK